MDEKKYQEINKEWAQIIAKCWMDPAFKEKLLKNPTETLKKLGIEIPSNKKLQVHENKDEIINLILPKKPEGELSEESLKKISGGYISATWCE